MSNMIKNSWHPARWVLAFFCLAVGLSLVATPLSQFRTRAQTEKPNSGQPDKAEVSVIKIPAGVAASAARPVAAAGRVTPGSRMSPLGQGYVGDVEPNGTSATATPLGGTNVVVRGNIFPNADVDFFSFSATTGDRVYAAIMSSYSSSASTDSQLRVFQPDGTTLIEFDEDDGSLGSLSSTLANVTIPSPGTYFLEVRHFSLTNTLRPYDLHFRLQSGAPSPEVEANDTPATANPLPVNGWVSGARNPAVATEQDWYSMALNAGDTVFLSLDLDPERDNVQWNGRLGVALFGDANNQILVVDDASVGSVANPLSEALFMTVKTAGTYYAFVDSATAATGGPTATYTLSVSVHPAANEGVNCTTYTSTDVPKTIGPAAGLVSSTITVPGNPRVADVDVSIVLNHALMGDIDAQLRSPAGNNDALFNDIGAAATGGQTMMDITLDDEAGVTPAFTVLKPVVLKPELNYRLDWFDGENAGGVWTLDLRDDDGGGAGLNGGTLTSWSLRICEQPPPPSCIVSGTTPQTIFTTDFEANDAGFTHSGTADEWARGLPNTVATTTTNPVAGITTCNSGVNCWKTDLNNTYEISSNQDLLSPPIALTSMTLSAPITLSWAQKYQIESATFDHYFVSVYEVGNQAATERHLYDWGGATMTVGVGSPTENIGESAGWGLYSADISSFYGKTIQIRFHLDSDTSINFAGVAIDDVKVTACTYGTTAADSTVSGSITDPNGVPIAGAVVNLSGTQNRKFITDANGNYRFENVGTGGFYSVAPSMVNYHFSPESRSFSQLGNNTNAAFTGTLDSVMVVNRIDTPEYFVRQHYLDFLGREPDESGFNFWSNQIRSCGADAACLEQRTINVSAAYFLSIEYMETGGLVDSLYRASYDRRPLFNEFMPDSRTVAQSVVVGNPGWTETLAANKQAFLNAWVQRPAFRAAYDGLANDAYVDSLVSHTHVSFTSGERDALVGSLNNQTATRADVLRQVAEDGRFVSAKRNETFVMMQYFGYLRRDPDASGYQFWLNKLNQFDGNFEQAEMVKAFIVSGEYRDRFRQQQ